MSGFTVKSEEVLIDAPIELAWEILTDAKRYGQWNPFTPRVETDFRLGSTVRLEVHLGFLRLEETELLESLEPPNLLAWSQKKLTLGSFSCISARREQRLTELGPNRCSYVSTDFLGGPLSPLVMLLFSRSIRQGFNRAARGLKRYAEEQFRKRKAPQAVPADLRRLESEAIGILRETAEAFREPVLLFSAGKDSAVILRLAKKAFAPSIPPFPLLHVDTTWKFPEALEYRDQTAAESGMKLIVHVNREGAARGIGPFSHGARTHTRIMKIEVLQDALKRHGFDVMIDGARGDEERFRSDRRLSDTPMERGETTRVFPLRNWTEIDVWRYIQVENIPLPTLYFAAPRPVVQRNGMLIVRADERMPLAEGEELTMRKVRFRTLGCWPLTGAMESEATDVAGILRELHVTQIPERSARAIDRPANDESGQQERSA